MKYRVFILSIALATSSLFAAATKIETKQAPAALGPYSQGVVAGNTVYVSGQIPLDPKTGKLTGQTVEEQTRQVIKNIEAILQAQGLSLENVVKCEVYLKDLKDFSAMNGVYGERFNFPVKPARTTLQVGKLPHDAMVKIAAIAYQD